MPFRFGCPRIAAAFSTLLAAAENHRNEKGRVSNMNAGHPPDPSVEIRDQSRFDQEVNTKGRLAIQIAAGVAIFAALMMSIIALVKSSQHVESASSAASTPVLKQSPAAAAALAAPTAAAVTIKTTIVPEGKKGPEGEKHDVFSVTNFNAKVGQPMKIIVDNTDDTNHSITSPEAGVNVITTPGVHTYTVVITKAGKFSWACVVPCDNWAMQHAGYMAGYFNVTAA